ncbi:hypothetical protein HDU87_004716 [Geranomyces variabilis]|uniref:Uncharacterized protein n=1 Tax=Geranomyces variabilis TaxID=109894 RepID=A0AAD5XQD9_9FUNG|nr:hypothetical protein HDU87_004716 [Geranomyces variabilis]
MAATATPLRNISAPVVAPVPTPVNPPAGPNTTLPPLSNGSSSRPVSRSQTNASSHAASVAAAAAAAAADTIERGPPPVAPPASRPQNRQQQQPPAAPPPPTGRSGTAAASAGQPQTGATVAQIFQFRPVPMREGDVPPRLNETQPVSLFWYADKHLSKAVESLTKVNDIDSTKFKRRNERVHRAQRLLLETLLLVYIDMDETYKASRTYRQQLPPEDQRELEGGFSENILFAAQALSCGFRIRGIEEYTTELFPSAQNLHRCMENVRSAFCKRAVTCPATPYDDLTGVLAEFDAAWVAFEQRICFCYFSVTYSGSAPCSEEIDMFQVLMSETIIRAVHHHLLTWNDIQSFEPQILVAVPRLCIVAALLHMPECINITDADHGMRWFRPKAPLLRKLQKQLARLPADTIAVLERRLVDSDDAERGSLFSLRREEAEEGGAAASAEKRVKPLMPEIERDATLVDVHLPPAAEGGKSAAGSTTKLTEGPPIGTSASAAAAAAARGVAPATDEVAVKPTAAASAMTSANAAAPSSPPKLSVLHEVYLDICRVADDLARGPQARAFTDVMHKVFSMHAEAAAGEAQAGQSSAAPAGQSAPVATAVRG